MRPNKVYRKNSASVNTSPRRQPHTITLRIGQERVRVSGDFATLMAWVRLALAERAEREAAA